MDERHREKCIQCGEQCCVWAKNILNGNVESRRFAGTIPEPCGSGQQSAIQSPETYFMASSGSRYNRRPQSAITSRDENSNRSQRMEGHLISSLRITKVSFNKDHVRDGEQRRSCHTPSVHHGGRSGREFVEHNLRAVDSHQKMSSV